MSSSGGTVTSMTWAQRGRGGRQGRGGAGERGLAGAAAKKRKGANSRCARPRSRAPPRARRARAGSSGSASKRPAPSPGGTREREAQARAGRAGGGGGNNSRLGAPRGREPRAPPPALSRPARAARRQWAPWWALRPSARSPPRKRSAGRERRGVGAGGAAWGEVCWPSRRRRKTRNRAPQRGNASAGGGQKRTLLDKKFIAGGGMECLQKQRAARGCRVLGANTPPAGALASAPPAAPARRRRAERQPAGITSL
jgi:hypothetical protein